jgi:RNA polymerase sigma-70 factor (ECF subfamily)
MQKITAEDGAIISRYQRGTKAAFNALVERHKQRAYHYASRLTNNPDEAADIVAETFLRVYRSLEGFKGESSFTTWLYRIETNCFLDMRKRSNARPALSLDEALQGTDGQLGIQIVDDRENAHERIEKSERITAIESGMKHLPEHQRTILLMYHAESMSYEDIASILALPIGTVKSRLNRARLSLRNVLRPCRNLFVVPKNRRTAMVGV